MLTKWFILPYFFSLCSSSLQYTKVWNHLYQWMWACSLIRRSLSFFNSAILEVKVALNKLFHINKYTFFGRPIENLYGKFCWCISLVYKEKTCIDKGTSLVRLVEQSIVLTRISFFGLKLDGPKILNFYQTIIL